MSVNEGVILSEQRCVMKVQFTVDIFSERNSNKEESNEKGQKSPFCGVGLSAADAERCSPSIRCGRPI